MTPYRWLMKAVRWWTEGEHAIEKRDEKPGGLLPDGNGFLADPRGAASSEIGSDPLPAPHDVPERVAGDDSTAAQPSGDQGAGPRGPADDDNRGSGSTVPSPGTAGESSKPVNIVSEVVGGLEKVKDWVETGVKDVEGISAKAKLVISAEQKLAPEFVSGAGTVITDVEQLLVLSEGAVTGSGLNFAADSAAYQQFLKLLADMKALAPVVDQGIAALKAAKTA